jgi:prepilin peptidase dependent protein B
VLARREFEGVRLMLNHPSAGRIRPRGLSIVEMMVGIVVGLFLVAGATTVFVTHLGNSRQMLVEARVNQDLRAAADLMSRDLRRAGYWENAVSGTIAAGASGVTVLNPYIAITPTGTSQIEYLFARNADNTPDNNEAFGFRRFVDVATGRGVIQMKTDNTPTWQTVTDPAVIDVGASGVNITTTTTVVQVGGACAKACPPPVGATWACPNPPTLTLRQYDITLTAAAVADARVIRTLQTRARVRNDQPAGVCPA